MPTIKEVHAKLNREQPFTQTEEKGLGKRNMAFIRNLQISRGLDKAEALKLYSDTNLKSKEALKKLAKTARKDVENRYPRHKVFKLANNKDFEKPIVKTRKRRIQTEEQKIKAWKKEEKDKIKTFFADRKSRSLKTFEKMQAAHKMYPDATLYELRKGVNSRASEKYRLNHGLPANYTGRIKEK